MIIETQAFSQSYESAPRPSPPPPVRKLDRRHTGTLRKKDTFLTGRRGEGGEQEPTTLPQEGLVLFKSFISLCIAQNPPYPTHRRGANVRGRILKMMATTSNTKMLTFTSLSPLSQLISDLSLRKILRIWRPNKDGSSCAEFPRWRPPHAEIDTCS
jgi:hypothetical protein